MDPQAERRRARGVRAPQAPFTMQSNDSLAKSSEIGNAITTESELREKARKLAAEGRERSQAFGILARQAEAAGIRIDQLTAIIDEMEWAPPSPVRSFGSNRTIRTLSESVTQRIHACHDQAEKKDQHETHGGTEQGGESRGANQDQQARQDNQESQAHQDNQARHASQEKQAQQASQDHQDQNSFFSKRTPNSQSDKQEPRQLITGAQLKEIHDDGRQLLLRWDAMLAAAPEANRGFTLARVLKHLPVNPKALRSVVSDWCDQKRFHFEQVWVQFLDAWPRTNCPAGVERV